MKYVFWGAIGLLIVIQVISYIVWRIGLRSPKKGQEKDHRAQDNDLPEHLSKGIYQMIETLKEVPYEKVTIVSQDGLRLSGRYYAREPKKPVLICCHGYRGTPTRDFSGGAMYYLNLGYNVLLIEQRAHLTSEGRSITMGVKERYDLLKWIDYVIERNGPETKIVLSGISMGGATVLMTCGLDLPKQVVGAIADAAYTSPKAIMLKVLKDMKLPPRFMYCFLWYGTWLFGGVNLSDRTADAIRAVQWTHLPILLIHGEADGFVPCEMGRKIAVANPDRIEFHSFPNAGHGLSYLTDRERYETIAADFLNRITA